MCTVCGCGGDEHHHEHEHDHDHAHSHEHGNHHHSPHNVMDLHFGRGPAHAHAPGLSQGRMVKIEQDIMAKNAQYADGNRRHFHAHDILVLNLMSSPGSGKTTLLTQTLKLLQLEHALSVIEGDQQTSQDAERIRATGVPAVQINTGKGCHLDAHMIGHALENLQPADHSIVFIENVGNLVCPAGFDLGEAAKVVILSVTEGEDKPLKYPDMFHVADLVLLNKIDLLPHIDFDVERCIEYIQRIKPNVEVMQVSARSGEGMANWCTWIKAQAKINECVARQDSAQV